MTLALPSIEQIAERVRSRAISPVDLVRGCLERIESRLELNAFITVMADAALGAAERAEREMGPDAIADRCMACPFPLKI